MQPAKSLDNIEQSPRGTADGKDTQRDTVDGAAAQATDDEKVSLGLATTQNLSKMAPFGSKNEILDYNNAIYERIIIIVPYKAPESVKCIENSYERINLKCLNLQNARYLNTKELTEEERKDRTLDFLGGFEIMDSEFRMFIFEGIGGEGRSINEMYLANERQRPNDRKYKMLYNPQVKFKNRIYLDFNTAIKKIRLRDTLTKIMGAPDVYIRSKVPEDMYDTL